MVDSTMHVEDLIDYIDSRTKTIDMFTAVKKRNNTINSTLLVISIVCTIIVATVVSE